MKNLFYIFLSLGLIGCAAEKELVPSTPATPTSNGLVTDCGGDEYQTVLIGDQEWMAENLRTTCYANGDPITNITDYEQWWYSNQTTGAWCDYDNNANNVVLYGKLYNHYAVSDPRNVCPDNWHVPSRSDWNTLLLHLDPSSDLDGSDIAGGKMKSTGTQYWWSPNTGATNESGFSALPSGYRHMGDFGTLGNGGWWWSSTTASNTTNAYTRQLIFDYGYLNNGLYHDKSNGLSVRCLRD